MSDLKLTGLNSSPDFSREIKTEKTSASKAGKKTRLSRDAFISGAKKAGRAAKEAGSCLVPEGYKKIYRGEKLDKYEIAETAGITALYGALIVGTGGAAGLALYAGGLSTMVGSGIIKHRKGIAKAARKLARKLNPKHLAKKVKDGSAKAALKKLKHPKALLAGAGVAAITALVSMESAAAASGSAMASSVASSSSRAVDTGSTSGAWIAGAVSGSSSSSNASFAGQGDPVLLAVGIAVTIAGGVAVAYWAHREDQKADQKIGSSALTRS